MNQQTIHSEDISRPWIQRFHPLTSKGFAWAAALPGLGILLFYALVLHVRFALGRWPRFGEALPTQLLSLHEKCVWRSAGFLLLSLRAVPVLIIAILFFRRWRHAAVYIFAYGIFVIIFWISMELAPHEFLNWFFD